VQQQLRLNPEPPALLSSLQEQELGRFQVALHQLLTSLLVEVVAVHVEPAVLHMARVAVVEQFLLDLLQ
jgi:hypothetical protein